MEEYSGLNRTLGCADSQCLEEHLHEIREIEKGIGFGPSAGCEVPDIGPTIEDYKNRARFPELGAQQTKLLAMALSCNLTRVATLQWSTGQSTTRHDWLDIPGADAKHHHGLTHDGELARDVYEGIVKWYVDRVRDLIQQLKALPDVNGGSVLDNTVVLWIAGENAFADIHSYSDMPYVIFGGGAGSIQKGQHLDFGLNRAHNDLLVTLQNAMGIEDTTFGDPELVQGPLSGILA